MADSVTLATARTQIAQRAAEFLAGTATGGSTTTLIDTNNLQYVDGYWVEQWVLFTSGTNNGLQRKISAYTSATSQATLYSAATAAVVSGDTYELYRRFSPADIKGAVNSAINKSWPAFYEPVATSYVFTAVQDTLQYTFGGPNSPVDPGDKGLIGIDYQRFTLASQSTFPYQRLAPDDYELYRDYSSNKVNTILQLRFNPDTNRLIRPVYGRALTLVSADTDRVRLGDPQLEWFYAQATAELWRLEANRSEAIARKDALGMLGQMQGEAERLKKDLGHAWPPKPIRRTRFYVTP